MKTPGQPLVLAFFVGLTDIADHHLTNKTFVCQAILRSKMNVVSALAAASLSIGFPHPI